MNLVPADTGRGRAPKFGTLKGKVPPVDPRALEPLSDQEVDAFVEGKY